MTTLSVGCGGNRQYQHSTLRDINLDLCIPLAKTDNFILADAQYLPFRSKAVDSIYASHIIEHLDNPRTFLKEVLRVSQNPICIIVPNYLEWAAYLDKTHRWVFAEGRIFRITHTMRMIASVTIQFKHFRRLLQKCLRKGSSDTVIKI